MGVTVGADRICLKAYAAERFDEWRHFPTRTVGADRIRPQPRISARMFGRLPAAPTDKNDKEEPK